MPAPPSPETKAFLTALEAYLAKPGELPDGAYDTMANLRKTLKGYDVKNEQLSPGEKEAKDAGGVVSSDEAVPYQKAASGPDQPSPGQIEYQKVMQAVQGLDPSRSSENTSG